MKPKLPLAPDEVIRVAAMDLKRASQDPEHYAVRMSGWCDKSAEDPGVCCVCLGGATLLSMKTHSELFEMHRGRGPEYWASQGIVHPADADRMLMLDCVRVGTLGRSLLYLCGRAPSGQLLGDFPTKPQVYGCLVGWDAGVVERWRKISESWCRAVEAGGHSLTYSETHLLVHPMSGWSYMSRENTLFFGDLVRVADAWQKVPEEERQWFYDLIAVRAQETVDADAAVPHQDG